MRNIVLIFALLLIGYQSSIGQCVGTDGQVTWQYWKDIYFYDIDFLYVDDVVDALKDLSNSGHRLYAFSNGNEEAVEGLLKAANIREYFLGVVSVDSVKTFKPNPAVYSHFLSETNSASDKAWLISSNPFDVLGALSHGMLAAWVKRSDKAIFDPWGMEPTITINSLLELNDGISNR